MLQNTLRTPFLIERLQWLLLDSKDKAAGSSISYQQVLLKFFVYSKANELFEYGGYEKTLSIVSLTKQQNILDV